MFSIMSQFETKYACFMCATEFPGSDTISLGNIVAATIFPSDYSADVNRQPFMLNHCLQALGLKG